MGLGLKGGDLSYIYHGGEDKVPHLDLLHCMEVRFWT